jgi:uncharacterized membrane protein
VAVMMGEPLAMVVFCVLGALLVLVLMFGLGYLTTKAEQEEDERMRHEISRRNARGDRE